MHALKDEPFIVKSLFLEANEALRAILRDVGDETKEIVIPRTENLFAAAEREGKLYVLQNGEMLWTHEGRDLFLLEPGDLIGIPEYYGMQIGGIRSEFAVHAKEYTAEDFLGKIEKSPIAQKLWRRLLSCHYAAMSYFVITLMEGEKVFTPKVRSYEAGQIIIEQGSNGSDVFTLLQGGQADVLVDGMKVGVIKEEQLFGLFAALTDCPRSASVVATVPSLVVTVSKKDFLDLIQHMPHLALKALGDLARAVNDLNAKVVDLKKERSEMLTV